MANILGLGTHKNALNEAFSLTLPTSEWTNGTLELSSPVPPEDSQYSYFNAYSPQKKQV